MRLPSSPASSAISTAPRTRCRTRSRSPSSAGRATAAEQSWRVDRHDGSQPRDRPAPPRAGVRTQGRAARAPRIASGRRGRRELDPRRPARARLHVLSPRPRRGGAGGADAARGRRPDDVRDRQSVPRRRARWPSGSSARSGRCGVRASRFASRPTTCSRSGCVPSSPSSTSSSTRLLGDGGRGRARVLCDEAIRLAKLLAVLMPDEARRWACSR